MDKFSCPKCGTLYTRENDMKRHWKWECGLPPRFQCPLCFKKFKRRFNMKYHFWNKHPSVDFNSFKF